MSGELTDERIRRTSNSSRFFVEHRQIGWVLLVCTMLWGWFGYHSMPQRKDPRIPVRKCLVVTPWPGNSAEKVELLVTKRIEESVCQNADVSGVESISRPGLSLVYVDLDERVEDTQATLDDIKIKLDGVQGLPDGAGPVQYVKDFGDTVALMLTVASPRIERPELEARAVEIRAKLRDVRATRPPGPRASIVYCFPEGENVSMARQGFEKFRALAQQRAWIKDPVMAAGATYMLLDFTTHCSDEELSVAIDDFIKRFLKLAELHPDSWQPVLIHDPDKLVDELDKVAGDKYSYRQLDRFTEKIETALKSVKEATRVERHGVLEEQVTLAFSQERLAAYGIQVDGLEHALQARNISGAGGFQENNSGQGIRLNASGEFKSEREIGDVPVADAHNAPVYLRDLVSIVRAYEAPPRYLNYLTHRDATGKWWRGRAVTVSVQMRPGRKIGDFGAAVDEALGQIREQLPADLVILRTSDQPRRVQESVALFTRSLFEAVVLVVLVSWIGFWEWRSALLMALAIPITLAFTFGLMALLGLDLQQVSIASLIIALGLLVDDPVVAGDAVKRALGEGHPRGIAAWLGPTRLAHAILYATITNIVAYLPLLLLKGDMGRYLMSLPLVITASLVASRIVSMTFIPLLGYYLLRPTREPDMQELRVKGFTGIYYRSASWCVDHRWKVVTVSLVGLVVAGLAFTHLRTQFFPKDLQYVGFVDLFLPADQTLIATEQKAIACEALIRQTCAAQATDGQDKLLSLLTFEGGGSPRFWDTLDPEPSQLSYAQVIFQMSDKRQVDKLTGPLSQKLSEELVGARADVRQLETGTPVGYPIGVRIFGEDLAAVQRTAEEIKGELRTVPGASRVRDDWGEEILTLNMETRSDLANLVGITNADIARSTSVALNGLPVTYLREGDRRIPVVLKMRMGERVSLEDMKNLYVYSSQGNTKVRLQQVAQLSMESQLRTIRRRDFKRCLTVGCYPRDGVLPSEVFAVFEPRLKKIKEHLPVGVTVEVSGEQLEQEKGFADLMIVMATSVAAIFLALLFQFKNAIKPLVVFAAVPYGIVGAILALWVMGAPFGFMAFLGVASLIGVIVSHIIVLFDFIEERREEGESMRESLLDAGIARLRPVLVTVGATVIALFPLAHSGGPLWEPLCYTQIGGLTMATVVTLILVPVLYTIFVLDLKILHWEEDKGGEQHKE